MAAPSSWTAAPGSTTSINLSWTDNDAAVATAYDIDRSTTSTGGFTQIATVGAGIAAYTNTGLNEGALYFYEVNASDALTTSTFSNIANAVTTLAAPSGLGATAVSATQINLTWTNNDGGVATAYDIDRSTTSTGGFAQIATVGTGVAAYTNTGLADGTKYFYEVDAVNATTTSAFSALANAVTTLNAPSGLSATAVSTSQINLGWTDNDASVATAYDIDRSTTSTGGFSQIATVGSGVTAYTNTGLTDGTQYFYEVDAVDAATTSAFSNIANAITILAAPSGLIAIEYSPSQINLKWTDNDGGVATAYDIDRSTTNTGGFAQIGTAAANATAYTDSSVASSTTYFYEVDAVDAVATSAFSNMATSNTSTTLGAPTSLTATDAASTQINLAWTDNDGGVATAYDIDRSTTSTGGFSQIATVGAGSTAYSDTGLTDNTLYFYEVQASASWTTSTFSNIANAMTTLAAPSGLSATAASAGQINLSWTNNSTVAAGVDIDRSTNGTSFTQIATVAASTTSYHDTTVFPSTKYYYEVQAFDGSTTSAFSSVANATTPTNEVGGVVNDDFYGTNGSAWSTQWTFVNQLIQASAADTISADQGVLTFTKTSGDVMKGNYNAYINTTTMLDSFQSALFSTNDTSSSFALVARGDTGANNYYMAYATLSGTNQVDIESVVSQTPTILTSFRFTFALNTTYELEFEVVTLNSTTTDLFTKVWATSTTEPTTWSVSTTNTTSVLQGDTGYTGIRYDPHASGGDALTMDNYEAVKITSSSASYLDNFQNSSTTGWSPLTASRWSVGTNGNSIRYYINTSSYAEGTNSTLGEYSLLNASGYTNVGDFTMTVDVAAGSTSTTGTGSNYAIVFGYQSAGNYYFMEFNAISGDTALYKVVGGATPSLIASASGAWITNTSYHSIKIQRKGTSISVWYDGESVLTTTDATFIGGQIGLGALNDAAYFDNVVVG